jgi:hypothetical protein
VLGHGNLFRVGSGIVMTRYILFFLMVAFLPFFFFFFWTLCAVFSHVLGIDLVWSRTDHFVYAWSMTVLYSLTGSILIPYSFAPLFLHAFHTFMGLLLRVKSGQSTKDRSITSSHFYFSHHLYPIALT